MKISWNSVTRFSQIVAIVLFVLVFLLGFQLGKMYQQKAYENALKAVMDGTLK